MFRKADDKMRTITQGELRITGDIWNGEGGNAAVGSFLMQYMESDWEFLRRVASMQGQVLIPEVRWPGARTYIGLLETGGAKMLEAGEYRIRKTLAKIPGQEDNVGRGYLQGSREILVWDRYGEYEPGERVNGSVLTVTDTMTSCTVRQCTIIS